MDLKSSFCSSLAAVTFIILSIISVTKINLTGVDSVVTLALRTVPATIVMGILGRIMGGILDRPRNLADSDYQTDVLKALKKYDRKMTLADLNEKLKPVEEAPPEIQIQAPEAQPEQNNGEQ